MVTTSKLDKIDLNKDEASLRELLDQYLDAAMRGDFKETRKITKRIYKLAQRDKLVFQN